MLAEHYGATQNEGLRPSRSRRSTWRRSCPLAQALDTFSVVYLQWLSNEVIWRARERVVKDHTADLTHRWSYDLDELATSIAAALKDAAGEAIVRWAAEAIPVMPYPSLSRTLRVMGATAREPRQLRATRDDVYRRLADEIAACRSGVERLLAVAVDQTQMRRCPITRRWMRAFARLFTDPAEPDTVREPAAWAAIIERRPRPVRRRASARARRRVRRH